MKRLLVGLLCLVSVSCFAAAPTLYTPWRAIHGTNGILVVTNPAGVYVGIDGSLLQPGSTNLTNWANLPTNVVSGANIWTQSGGTAFPTSAGAIETTNLSAWTKLIAKGAFIKETRSRTLTLGTNVLSLTTNALLLLDSPTNDAAQVVIELGPGVSSGQELTIVNNATNKGFTLYDAGTAAGIQGTFTSTTFWRGIDLVWNGIEWIETSRFDPSSLAPGAMNPTDGFIPVRGSATTFTNSHFVVRGDTTVVTNQTAVEKALLWFQNTNQTLTVGIDGPNASFLTASKELDIFGTNGIVLNSPGNFSIVITTQATNQFSFSEKKFFPGQSNAFSLGSPTFPWKELYLGTNSFYLGTNVYSDGGASLLRNGVAVGASSGPSFSDLVWTNNLTDIEPSGIGANTNHIKIFGDGAIKIGQSGLDPSGGDGLFIVRNVAAGDPNNNSILVQTLNGAAQSYFDFTVSDAQLVSEQSVIAGGLRSSVDVFISPNFTAWYLIANDNYLTTFEPAAGAGTTPYIFNTGVGHTSGDLLAVNNLSVGHFTVASTNGVTTPAITAYGAGSHPWQFGRATNTVNAQLAATNILEVVVNGVSYLVPAALK